MGTCHSSFLEVSQLQLRTPTKVSEPVKRRDESIPAATRRVFDFVTERAHIDRFSVLRFLREKFAPRFWHCSETPINLIESSSFSNVFPHRAISSSNFSATFRLTSPLEATPENSTHKYKILVRYSILKNRRSMYELKPKSTNSDWPKSPLKRCHSVTWTSSAVRNRPRWYPLFPL